jgi:hypothetical protein
LTPKGAAGAASNGTANKCAARLLKAANPTQHRQTMTTGRLPSTPIENCTPFHFFGGADAAWS